MQTFIMMVALVLSTMMYFSSCDEEDAEAALESLLASVELSDCYETSEEGYVPDSTTTTDSAIDAAALSECTTALIDDYDLDQSGSLDTDTEVTELNEDVTERKTAKLELYTEDGLDETTGAQRDADYRKILREVALAECLDDFDSTTTGTQGVLDPAEQDACAAARRTMRANARLDLRCTQDTTGECSPVAASAINGLFKERKRGRNTFVAGVSDDGKTVSDLNTARSSYRSGRRGREEGRSSREESNRSSKESGESSRRERGSFDR